MQSKIEPTETYINPSYVSIGEVNGMQTKIEYSARVCQTLGDLMARDAKAHEEGVCLDSCAVCAAEDSDAW